MVYGISLYLSSDAATVKNNSYVTFAMNPPLVLDKTRNHYCRVLSASIPYVTPNVSAALKNNFVAFQLSVGGDVITSYLPDGRYSIIDLQNSLNELISTNSGGVYTDIMRLCPYESTGKSIVEVTNFPEGFSLFYNNDIAGGITNVFNLLGFNSDHADFVPTYNNQIDTSDNKVNLNNLTTIHIVTNIIEDSYLSGNLTNVVASVTPDVSPYMCVIYNPPVPIDCLVNMHVITNVVIELRDQNFNPIDMVGETFTVTMQIYENIP